MTMMNIILNQFSKAEEGEVKTQSNTWRKAMMATMLATRFAQTHLSTSRSIGLAACRCLHACARPVDHKWIFGSTAQTNKMENSLGNEQIAAEDRAPEQRDGSQHNITSIVKIATTVSLLLLLDKNDIKSNNSVSSYYYLQRCRVGILRGRRGVC